jgi:casein kinase 1 delta/casein kinase I family protein HRR25
MGVGKQGNVLFTIDFGLAKEFSDDEEYRDVEGLRLGGTKRYASINHHKGRGR